MGWPISRVPAALRKRVREVAKRENMSVDEFVSSALTGKLSALLTEEYLAERSKRGSRKRFDVALAKVRNREPEENDAL
jgi:hypothetical protein